MVLFAIIIGSAITALVIKSLKNDVWNSATELAQLGEKPRANSVNEHTKQLEEINQLTDITNVELVDTNLQGDSREAIIDELIEKLYKENILTSKKDFKQAIIEREEESSTGIGMNMAIPHGKSDAVKVPGIAFGIKKAGVDWYCVDDSLAKFIFMIALPEGAEDDAHLKILQMLSRKMADEDFRDMLLNAQTDNEAYKLLKDIRE
ncbi:PTS sugar transporter subunit IIA [Gracilibacillus xinjiangensis]|uniref:PTS sugar transporter subunit IIA n=1 Tax=Gracilibacillus xinjiangensis TaxID=1193282 RepID=A0ABV8WU60_9BACI